MSRLNASTPDGIRFRQNDTPPTRAQKLELTRQYTAEQLAALEARILTLETAEDVVVIEADSSERVRAWWETAPSAKQTLIIWPFAEVMTLVSNMSGSVGFLGGTLAAPVAIDVYRNPTFTGAEITGGEVIGTITIDNADNSFTFATVDGQDFIFEANETIAAKWPDVTEAGANAGAFVIYALFGAHATFGLLLAGDQQTGEDILLLAGDQTDGDDWLLLVGGT